MKKYCVQQFDTLEDQRNHSLFLTFIGQSSPLDSYSRVQISKFLHLHLPFLKEKKDKEKLDYQIILKASNIKLMFLNRKDY